MSKLIAAIFLVYLMSISTVLASNLLVNVEGGVDIGSSVVNDYTQDKVDLLSYIPLNLSTIMLMIIWFTTIIMFKDKIIYLAIGAGWLLILYAKYKGGF